MVAINIEPNYPLARWKSFWTSTGAGDVVWAQDVNGAAIQQFHLVALGTEVLVDRQGKIAFRSDGPANPKKLETEIKRLLR